MNRIITFAYFAGLLLTLPTLLCGEEERTAKPNIILIFTDDHGWADFGLQGVDKDVRTPNLDQLVRDGVRFARGYVTAPQCTPSRAGLVTGVYQQRLGVEHNGIPMRSEVVTLPERLKAAGYVSGISGKWHLDVDDQRKSGGPKARFLSELLPHRQGFDEYFTGFMQDYTASHGLDGTPFPDAPRKVREEGCRVVLQTRAALSFLNRRTANPDQPWFLYLAYMAPHVPLESPEPWFSQTPKHLPLARRQALALIAAIDDGVGRIRAKLKEMGEERNTLIFLIGDNGAPLGSAWDGSINLTMVGQKGMLSEGGIRVPFIAAWPGTIPAGQVFDHPVISLDVAATAVAQAGLPRDEKLDGVNLVPFLTGENKAAPHDALYWRWSSQAAVLEMPYKLIVLGSRERLLFDVTHPEGENIERDLRAKHPEIAVRLEAKLEAWSDQLQPPGLPTTFDRHHEGLFAEHRIIEKSEAGSSSTGPVGTVQGWIARNGNLVVRNGSLVFTPNPDAPAGARPFITHAGLDLQGPVTATLRLRNQKGGQGTLTWRTKTTGFSAENTLAFDWPDSAEWREVTTLIPVKDTLIHLRITPAQGSQGFELQSIQFRGKNGKVQSWRFDTER